MLMKGKLYAESPIYRGNARKTLFTRDGDGTQRLVSLAGEVSGTAEALMDAFIGRSRNGRNLGLLNRLWLRLFGDPLPEGLIANVDCRLREECYPRNHFFDLRMGLKLDEDRWAAEAGANYKIETLFRNSVFDFFMGVDDKALSERDNAARLYYLLRELQEGRFWFGAGKSKGLGRCRLEMEIPFAAPQSPPKISQSANHLTLELGFTSANPMLVGWNWGKVDPAVPAFAAVEGRLLIEAMRDLPEPVQQRLGMAIGGPIVSADDWKKKLAGTLPRAIGAWLKEAATEVREVWSFPEAAVKKLGKGKHPLSKKIITQLAPVVNTTFPSREAAETAFTETLGEREAKKARRVLTTLTRSQEVNQSFPAERWEMLAGLFDLDEKLAQSLASEMDNEQAFLGLIDSACQRVLPRLHEQVDQQIDLLRSDAWVDQELANREDHLTIKKMLLNGDISEDQWGNPQAAPKGVREAGWREFLRDHARVRYRHMLNAHNLRKSIANDENSIAFLKLHRMRTRQELSQPHHIDFRGGGEGKREISRKYGKPYDTVFMRMLTWQPSAEGGEQWEVFVPGATLKGAFRKRASQVLCTLWGEGKKTTEILNRLFGAQRERGLVFFSDAYLHDPAQESERAWCSMDGVRINPTTGKPIEEAKCDYLFAYGKDLEFHLHIDLQDIQPGDEEALSVFGFLLEDFRRGDIPLGGGKGAGLGWVEGRVERLQWLEGRAMGLGQTLFGKQDVEQDGIWQRLSLGGEAANGALARLAGVQPSPKAGSQAPPKSREGFISHRAFGGYCGTLVLEGAVLTPLHIRESGEPSHHAEFDGQRVNGWDFFSLASPEAPLRPAERTYTLPSKSLRGMVRHLYSIASGAGAESSDLGRLNPADALFGWVGSGPNQALMGRLAFGFGTIEQAELSWFKLPYPYGEWQYRNGQWGQVKGASATPLHVAKRWRMYPHAPAAPCIARLADFQPDTVQADYLRALLPGARCRFSVRFWNLEREELQRLLWCLGLEEGLAHKLGKGRQLGLGSLRLKVLAESFLIDWQARYSGKPEGEWRRPVRPEQWRNTDVIQHYGELRRILDAEPL